MVTLTDTPIPEGRVASRGNDFAVPGRDQAERLRELMARELGGEKVRRVEQVRDGHRSPSADIDEPCAADTQRASGHAGATQVVRRACPLIAVASGKGGVGKTTIAANLAVALAHDGVRVTLVDADLGMANADLILGVTTARRIGPSAIAAPDELRAMAVQTPSGVRLVPGATGVASMADLDLDARRRLVAGMLDLTTDADVLLLDTSAGASRTTLGFTAAADSVLLVSTPDPSSIADVYATLKCLAHNAGTRAAQAGRDPEQASSEQLCRIGLLVNMADSEREAEQTARRLCDVSARYLGRSPQVLGWVPRDPNLGRSVRLGRAHMEHTSRGRSVRSIQGVAKIVRGVVERWPGWSQGAGDAHAVLRNSVNHIVGEPR